MRLVPGVLCCLLVAAGCSAGDHPPKREGTLTFGGTSDPSAAVQRVDLDLTGSDPRQAVGLGGRTRTLYYAPQEAPVPATVRLPGGVLHTPAFQVTATTAPVGRPHPRVQGAEPAYLLVLAHYDSADEAVAAVRSQAGVLGIDPAQVTGSSVLRGAAGRVAVLVQVVHDVDHGGYQIDYELAATRS
ncbi:hypothetical protein D9V37_01585 [Nocardioides mangrovicus]|uniref:Lipoprotein n=1 Tax=Nocardioides mangrovicus TaxID=2478913 RepID=A0A3L8P6T2_9ACTN|nr:hypothetical protein [Nocardioides mangrovicus]RLV50687.1 hypothetical protein D9V37_01585 [Nocardioides mangrovicus]